MVFGCEDLGQQAIALYVTAPNGQTSFCTTFIIVEDNDNYCEGSGLAKISGTISTEESISISGVEVQLQGSDYIGLTDENGAYAMPEMPHGGNRIVRWR